MTKQDVKQMSTDKQDATPVHESIHAAIAASVREVRIIGKSDRNKFDGYDFASIDKFLALVNPICGRNGLFPIVQLANFETYENTNSKGSKSIWARFHYGITMHHATGQTLGPVDIMVSVPMNGAQASGSAQSYALKQFFRSMLMIPTGDKDDADLNGTEQHHSIAVKTVSPDQFIKLRDRAIEADVPEQKICAAFNAQSFEQFPAEFYDKAMNKLKATMDAKAPAPKDDLEGDGIPDFDGGAK